MNMRDFCGQWFVKDQRREEVCEIFIEYQGNKEITHKIINEL